MPETDAWKVCASAMPATKRTSERTIEVTFAERFIISPFLLESSLKLSLSGRERHMPLGHNQRLTKIIYQSGALAWVPSASRHKFTGFRLRVVLHHTSIVEIHHGQLSFADGGPFRQAGMVRIPCAGETDPGLAHFSRKRQRVGSATGVI